MNVQKMLSIASSLEERMNSVTDEISTNSATIEEVTAKCQEIAATAATLVTEDSN